MLIKGIWSFIPETKHIITFFNPLNPIVGPNSTRKNHHARVISAHAESLENGVQSLRHRPSNHHTIKPERNISLAILIGIRKSLHYWVSIHIEGKGSGEYLKIKKKHKLLEKSNAVVGRKHARRDAKMHYSEVNHQRKICGNQISMKTAVRSTSFMQQQ
ncbi:hypothetical protein L3X38_003364 [Prunus dulcis]|uniref:Uncharacterized protein n=1 Tax=Prunus dulcis TaxID=3755 RepID=A0AAD4ZLV9_PRUDU|nr:hypothetical protein L3X38_003364 [Prunus dulcis]